MGRGRGFLPAPSLSEALSTLRAVYSQREVKKMEQMGQVVADQFTRTLVPMVGSMLVVVLVALMLLSRVRSRFVRGLAGYAAMFVWLGWMANYFKVV